MAKKNYNMARTWQREIRKRAFNIADILFRPLALIVVVFLIIAAILNVVFPKDGSDLVVYNSYTIGNSAKDWLSAIAAAIGILVSLSIIPPLKDWFSPVHTRYHSEAMNLIEELENEKCIDENEASQLRDIASKNLTTLDDKGVKSKKAKEQLHRASCEFSEVIEKKEATS